LAGWRLVSVGAVLAPEALDEVVGDVLVVGGVVGDEEVVGVVPELVVAGAVVEALLRFDLCPPQPARVKVVKAIKRAVVRLLMAKVLLCDLGPLEPPEARGRPATTRCGKDLARVSFRNPSSFRERWSPHADTRSAPRAISSPRPFVRCGPPPPGVE
jgi:hypothetical protein